MKAIVLHPGSLVVGAALALPLSGQGDVEFFEDFESGGAGWTMTTEPGCNYTGPSLWHISTDGECGSVTRMAAYNRHPVACDFFTGPVGGCNRGSLWSPEFILDSPAIGLEFDYLMSMSSAFPYAGTLIYIARGDIVQWVGVLGESSSLQHARIGVTTPPSWQELPVRIGFWTEANYFEDEDSGSGVGVMIDNIRVVNRPRILAVSPDHVPNDESSLVTIDGIDLLGATEVRFGEISVPFLVESDTKITARVSPTFTAGWVDVSVSRGPWSGRVSRAFDRFAPPVEIGRPCGGVRLDWSGAPTLGQTCSVTTSGLGDLQVILIDWSNIGTRTPHTRRALDCSVGLVADQVVSMLFYPTYTFQIPGGVGLIGEHLRIQAVVLSTPPVATQIWDATIGE